MPSSLRTFFAELRRRSVWRAAAAYGATALATALAVAELYDDVGLPDGTPRMVIIVLAVGFPVALALSWIYEVKREGPIEEPSRQLTTDERRKSIVVLPFDNMSPDPGDAYFSDGLTEEIITQLAHLRSLRVISRNSAMVLKDTKKDTRSIGRELNVQYVMEGSVRKAGDRLRITAQLIRAETDEHLWAETFARELEDVFEIQSDIALSVAEAMRASLDKDEVQRITSRPTQSLDAHDAYLLGRQHWWRFTREGLDKAKHYFEQAIEMDPSYAEAHAGLAYMYLVAGGGGLNLIPTPEAMGRTRSSAERAIALKPSLGDAHGTLGLALCWFYWEWSEAAAAVRRAVELEPSSSLAWGCYAHVMDALGEHDESVYGSDRFVALDPLQAIALNNASLHYCHARRVDRAMELAERCHELDPSWWGSTYAVAYAHLSAGSYNKALASLETVREHLTSTYTVSILAFLLGKAGRGSDFQDAAASLEAQAVDGAANWTEVAVAYMGTGDHELALDYLERASEQWPPPNNYTAWIGTLPIFDPIRRDPRFQQVLMTIGLA